MNEIGGYIELDNYRGTLLHQNALALNLARNCLAYLIRCKKIKTLYIPFFLCSSAEQACKKEGAEIKYYSIGIDFLPLDFNIKENEWVYVVNYYGQISNNNILELKHKYNNIIVDNVQAYYQMHIDGIDTIYTCRKFFGVPDGAFLYTDKTDAIELETDIELPKSINKQRDYGLYIIKNNRIYVTLNLYQGQLFTYLPDYKNYYYLIDEDSIIPKSLGESMDKSCRRPATRRDCKVSLEGTFLNIPERLDIGSSLRTFRSSYESKDRFLNISDIRDDILVKITKYMLKH